MTFKSPVWRPVAFILAGLNVLGAAFAVASAEPMHAGAHVTVALAFGFWADRLRRRTRRDESEAGLDSVEEVLTDLRAQVSETHDRMDFVERLLARDPESQRLGRDR